MEKAQYLQNLKRFIQQMPSLDHSYDERSLRDALLGLERHVSLYCRSHDIGSPPPHDPPPFLSLPPTLAATNGNGSRSQNGSHPRSSTPTDFVEETDSPEAPATTKADSDDLPRSSPVISSKSHLHLDLSPQSTAAHTSVPPAVPGRPPPPPPPPPPLPVSMMVPRAQGVRGTVQFVGSPHSLSNQQRDEPDLGQRRPETDTPLPGGLLEEITSIGQAHLRTTNRERSPGGTPLRQSRRLTFSNNSDVLQRALMNRFKSLHSTPKRQSTSSDRSSFDASTAWSDINSSVDNVDPDITGSDLASDILHRTADTPRSSGTAV